MACLRNRGKIPAAQWNPEAPQLMPDPMRRRERPSLRDGASAHRGGGSGAPHDRAARAAHHAAGADTRSGKQTCHRACGSAAAPLAAARTRGG